MTNEQKLIRECLDWLIDFQVTANLNDNAWERLGDLIDRCGNALKTNDGKTLKVFLVKEDT